MWTKIIISESTGKNDVHYNQFIIIENELDSVNSCPSKALYFRGFVEPDFF